MLTEKMQEFAGSGDRQCIFGRKPNPAAIISTTRVGLAAAAPIFRDTGAILLLEEEKQYGFTEVYPVDHEAFWWYAFAWWT